MNEKKTQLQTPSESEFLEAIEQVVDHLWNDELRDYEAREDEEEKEDHIFKCLQVLNRWSTRKRRGEG